MLCDHAGPHSGASRYSRATGELRLVLTCDRCGTDRRELATLNYRPRGRSVVGQLAESTACELGLGEPRIARVRLAAMICDVGRDQIPPEILNKRGPLTREEWTQVRRQPELGSAVLSDASFDDIRDWVLSRRERMDGRGYPRGLRGEKIPLEARILAIAEAYVAMTTDRSHTPERYHEEAVAELQRCAGPQFDPAVVQAFITAAARRAARIAARAA
ncbi:MAG: HD domain-containing protein [Actinomycetota bacterium]|nr:HD domain-containing protein [Actinomycetota bacterium]